MNSTKHIIVAILFSIIMVVIGTVGYMLIEGWNLLDALYMTVITYSTVGYSEIHTISDMGRLYTVFLIFLAVETPGILNTKGTLTLPSYI